MVANLEPAGRLIMAYRMRTIEGSITAPRGFRAAGIFCDIKRLGTGKGSERGPKRDLALIVSDTPATVAGMFTTNQVVAAPVKICHEVVRRGTARAIVANSGNANACTGRQGLADARAMAREVARVLGLRPQEVLVASTGRIGVPMPMEQVRAGIQAAARELAHGPQAAAAAAEAIMTSDTRPKQIAREWEWKGRVFRLGGIAKGAGMIHPGMSPTGRRPASMPRHATMLAFLTTDAAVDRRSLQMALTEAVAGSFNRITVDGDMSTNDTVLLLANGCAQNEPWNIKSRAFLAFETALQQTCLDLAQMIVRDGEGVHRVVTVRVFGARNQREADVAARSVANSPLVKTSWHGGDPNWGRIMDALGYSSARIVEEKVDIGYAAPGSTNVLWCLRRGRPTNVPFKKLCEAVAPLQFELHIRLNLGHASAVMYATDLTEAYVEFNKGDVSDPASLGG
ncbi:MAG: bifunctional glutamate N-acetyltransferase/amino-acid acetyltransferase ArgJ [Verrucomicrobiota bacterium]|nr:bifunctional glutamate N-acetyltransferase/amino-acid acetyltransferase ArgJ [Limisphaera sp.]MDW8383030.1 bifunctional glutamate N-acetyltransferase/amino-acid acetyltransferase ArgJ [Verrucomicrobiota bacterium]